MLKDILEGMTDNNHERGRPRIWMVSDLISDTYKGMETELKMALVCGLALGRTLEKENYKPS